MRAFVALELPDPVRQQLAALGQRLQALGDVRGTPTAQIHVTLKFLGDVVQAQAAAIGRHLAAARWPRLQLRPRGLGQFPPRGAPRVLWAGLGGETAQLMALARELEAVATDLGVAAEDRPFRAHVTLGRCRSPRGSAALQRALQELGSALDGPDFTATAVTLFRSEPGSGGAVHTAIAHAQLL